MKTKKQPKIKPFEAVFKTTLKRYDAIEKKYLKAKNLTWVEKNRLREVMNRAEIIISEMYYKRVLEPNLIKRFKNEYIYLNEIDLKYLLDVDSDGDFYDELEMIFIHNSDLLIFVKKTWDNIHFEIEKHNYKLF